MPGNGRARMRGPSLAPGSVTSIANRLLWDNWELLDRRPGERLLRNFLRGKTACLHMKVSTKLRDADGSGDLTEVG